MNVNQKESINFDSVYRSSAEELSKQYDTTTLQNPLHNSVLFQSETSLPNKS